MGFWSNLAAFALGVGTAYVCSEAVRDFNKNLQLNKQLLKEIKEDKKEFAKCVRLEIKKKYANGTLMDEIYDGAYSPLPPLSSAEFFEHENNYLQRRNSADYFLTN